MFDEIQNEDDLNNGYIISTTPENFNKLIKFLDSKNSHVKILDKIFAEGPSFSVAYKEKALKYCQQYTSQKHICLLVEDKYYLTVWFEKHFSSNGDQKNQDQALNPPQLNQETDQDQNREEVISQNNPIHQYRGIAYTKSQKSENQLPLLKERWIEINSKQKSSKKQYRGKFY